MVVATITLLCYFTTIPRQKWIGVPRPSSFIAAMASSAAAWLAQLRVGEGGFSLHHHHFSASSHIRIRERKPVTHRIWTPRQLCYYTISVVERRLLLRFSPTATVPRVLPSKVGWTDTKGRRPSLCVSKHTQQKQSQLTAKRWRERLRFGSWPTNDQARREPKKLFAPAPQHTNGDATGSIFPQPDI